LGRTDFHIHDVRLPLRHLGTQVQLAGIGQLLRCANADVGKVAVGVTREGLGAADAHILIGEGWIGQRADLKRNLLRGLQCIVGG